MENEKNKIKKSLEALLFVSSGSVSIVDIAKFLNISQEYLQEIISEMNEEYDNNHGLQIQNHKNKIQLTTSPSLAEMVERFLDLEITTSLSRAALETLSIISYNQPITRPQIDDVRGVNSDYIVRSLMNKGLIEELGRADAPGRPILYGTTEDFLNYFGLKSLDDLPEIQIQSDNNGNGVLKQ